MTEDDALRRGKDVTPLFLSEEEAATLLGIHRTTLRTLALDGRAPIDPIHVTQHKRIYRRIDVERLGGGHRMSVEQRKTKSGKTRYLARVKVGNVQVGTKTFGRKSDAEEWEREQKHLLETGRPLAPKRVFTLAQFVSMFQEARASGNPHTIDTDNNNLAALPAVLLARPLASVQAGRSPRSGRLRDVRSASVRSPRRREWPLSCMACESGARTSLMSSSSCPSPGSDGEKLGRPVSAGSVRMGSRNSTSNARTPIGTRRRGPSPGEGLGRFPFHRADSRSSERTPPARILATICSRTSSEGSSR